MTTAATSPRAMGALLVLLLTGAVAIVACSSSTSDGGATDADAGADARADAADSGGRDPNLPVGACRATADCSTGGGGVCGLQTLPAICNGRCDVNVYAAACTSDDSCADAGPAMVCSGPSTPGPCFCSPGGAIPAAQCVKGCATNADCGPGLACGATHRCEAAPCTQPAECGSANLSCTAAHCAAKPCTSDGDCAGYCVNGTCSAALGACYAPVP
jgi:hypothetical protein